MFTRLAFLFLLMIVIDLINHFGLRVMLRRLRHSHIYRINFIIYWGITVAIVVSLPVTLLITGYPGIDYVKYRTYFLLFGIFMVFYMPRIIFALFVIVQSLWYLLKKLFSRKKEYIVKRHKRKNYYIQKTGIVLAFLSSVLVIYGMTAGKSDFKVRKVYVEIPGLPAAFDGFRIAQFSDAHLGSFTNRDDVKKGLELLQDQSPDIIVFTGDMVNNIADEMEPYMTEFKKLKAPYGKYSILGNHDMSDYVKWKNFTIKREYIDKLIAYQEECGFRMLLNSNVIIKREGDSIALAGVENWGLPPFKQYGNLDKALEGIKNINTKILLSHDPTHWTGEVLSKTGICLTLSGHTHGGQIGLNFAGIKWSPVQYVYKNWMGLYKQGNQYLYVNPGFGYLGFPGRIGINPELTIIILRQKPQYR
jgi:predicted MPP superfamily phosphohydrolase